jgi:hypothetical protein
MCGILWNENDRALRHLQSVEPSRRPLPNTGAAFKVALVWLG